MGDAAAGHNRNVALPKPRRLALWLRQAALLRYAIEDWGERLWRVRLRARVPDHSGLQAVTLLAPSRCILLRRIPSP